MDDVRLEGPSHYGEPRAARLAAWESALASRPGAEAEALLEYVSVRVDNLYKCLYNS